MQIKDLTNYLEEIAPLHLQEGYDNAGLVVGDPHAEIQGVLVCLDSTEAVLDEAIQLNCNLVIAHHPIIFQGLKSITPDDYVSRCIIKAIQNGISIYAIHTNLDNVLNRGVNQKIAEKIGLENVQILKPRSTEDENIGSGAIGNLPNSMDERLFINLVKEQMGSKVIRSTALLGKDISRVALCGGSGSFLIQDAIQQNADVFVTADIKYHQFFDADQKILLLDIGHYESEQYTVDLLYSIIRNKFSNFAAHYSKVITNPIFYY